MNLNRITSMKKIGILCCLLLLASCAANPEGLEYNRLAAHINVVGQTSKYVVYEYSDVRIDEVAAIAGVYCNDQNGKTAELYDIGLRPDHRRRATFICR